MSFGGSDCRRLATSVASVSSIVASRVEGRAGELMKRAAMTVGMLVVLASAAGCVTNPKKTVLNLDTTDPKWISRECVAVRKQIARYHDGDTARAIVGFAGNYAAPYAGTGASLLMTQRQDKRRAEMNKLVKDACVTRHHGLL